MIILRDLSLVILSAPAMWATQEPPPALRGLEVNSGVVVQSAARSGFDQTAVYYGAQGAWRVAENLELRTEIEGGRQFGSQSDQGIGDQIGSHWKLNELREDPPLFVPILHLAGTGRRDTLKWQLGKISPQSVMDGNGAARSKLTKFIAEPFFKNSAVAFGRKGLGGALDWKLSPRMQLALCASDANARSTQAGFSTWRGEWYRAAELTVRPPQGTAPAALRVLVWGTERGGVHDGGWGTSMDWEFASDWMAFARAGGGSEHFAASRRLLSGGVAWTAPFGRKRDFLALGIARGEARVGGSSAEMLGEIVYRRQITRHIAFSPDVQYVRRTTGAPRSGTWLLGLRCVASFGP